MELGVSEDGGLRASTPQAAIEKSEYPNFQTEKYCLGSRLESLYYGFIFS